MDVLISLQGVWIQLPHFWVLPGLWYSGGLRAPLQHAAQERLFLLQALLSVRAPLGYSHLGVARLALPDNGREAKHGESPCLALRSWLVCTAWAGILRDWQFREGIHVSSWHRLPFPVMSCLFFFFLPPAFQYKCLVEGCAEKFKSSKDRKDHLVTIHLYPADFRFDRPKKVKR